MPRISIAPMMQRTDRHFRYFMRLLSRRAFLYTEMVVAQTLLNGDPRRILPYADIEHPLALQVGGDDPSDLAACARIAEAWGYDEINLNVGCPSERVQKGNFGVCLMGEPGTVARCVEAMRRACGIPVTVKHRIGYDDRDRYEDMRAFVRAVASAGCEHFTVHARKAWLKGLSPADNRNVPPLRYGDVYRLKDEFPHLTIEINGGIGTVDEAREQLSRVDAVMIGRAAYDRPFEIAGIDAGVFGDAGATSSRYEIAEKLADYAAWWIGQGGKLSHIARHIMQLYAGRRGASAWRRALAEGASAEDPEVIRRAAARVEAQASPRAARAVPA